MIYSDNVAELATALSKCQGAIIPAEKDGKNPHFKSKFSTLYSVWQSVRQHTCSNNLAVLQEAITLDKSISVTTLIMHSSGQWIKFEPLTIPISKMDAQGVGSGITYAKRYALCAALGVVSDEDDDGEIAVGRSSDKHPAKAKELSVVVEANQQTKISKEQLDILQEHFCLTDQSFRKNFLEHMISKWSAHTLDDIDANLFEVALTGMKRNIEKNFGQQCA